MLGRFISPDPAPRMGIPLSIEEIINPYLYCMNNPVRFMDPTGMRTFDDDPNRPTAAERTYNEEKAVERGRKAAENSRDRDPKEAARITKAMDKKEAEIQSRENDSEASYQKLIGGGFTVLIGDQAEIGRVWDTQGGNGLAITLASGVGLEASFEMPGLSEVVSKILDTLLSTGGTSTIVKQKGTIEGFSGPTSYVEGKLVLGFSMDLKTNKFTSFSSGPSVGGGAYKGYTWVIPF